MFFRNFRFPGKSPRQPSYSEAIRFLNLVNKDLPKSEMSTPDKTNETLNLAEALDEDPSASESLTSNSLKDTNKKVQIDDVNANLDCKTPESLTKRLKDLDISFQQKVVTKESSSDFVVHEDWVSFEDEVHRQPSPFRESYTPSSDVTETEQTDFNEEHELTVIKPDDDQNWKPDKGKVYSRVLQIQQSKPKKYVVAEFSKATKTVQEEVEKSAIPAMEKTELISCSKCGRKVSPATMDRHLQFCFLN